MNIKAQIGAILVKLREKTNPYLGPIRRKALEKVGKENFTIISNNCRGGHLYRWYSIGYDSPTIGMYLFSEDYIKLIYNLKHYLNIEPKFVTYKESKYRGILEKRGGSNIKCPIGILDDIEIVFLHYRSPEEARDKWTRRKARIHWHNIFFKMSEQNECTLEHLCAFDRLPTEKKFVFTHKDYGLESQIIFKDFENDNYVLNDTTYFNRYINLTRWLLQSGNYKKYQ